MSGKGGVVLYSGWFYNLANTVICQLLFSGSVSQNPSTLLYLQPNHTLCDDMCAFVVFYFCPLFPLTCYLFGPRCVWTRTTPVCTDPPDREATIPPGLVCSICHACLCPPHVPPDPVSRTHVGPSHSPRPSSHTGYTALA